MSKSRKRKRPGYQGSGRFGQQDAGEQSRSKSTRGRKPSQADLERACEHDEPLFESRCSAQPLGVRE